MAKKVPVTNEDRQKSYFKYYLEDIEAGPKDKYNAITKEPLDNAAALHIDDRNDLFQPGDLSGEFGWWQMADGTALIANQTFFKGVTGEMFDWWFAWHSIDRLRYAIWDSEDHYDVYLDDPARARDMSLSMRERHLMWREYRALQVVYEGKSERETKNPLPFPSGKGFFV